MSPKSWAQLLPRRCRSHALLWILLGVFVIQFLLHSSSLNASYVVSPASSSLDPVPSPSVDVHVESHRKHHVQQQQSVFVHTRTTQRLIDPVGSNSADNVLHGDENHNNMHFSSKGSNSEPYDDSNSDSSHVRWTFTLRLPLPTTNGSQPYHHHDFTEQLPPGARKFCTAPPEDSTMEVMEPYVPTSDPLEIPNRTVWAEGCAEPVMILPHQGVLMYPQQKCGALRLWKLFDVAATYYGGGVSDYVSDKRAEGYHHGNRRRHRRTAGPPLQSSSLNESVGVSSEPPSTIVKKCLDRCLDSPCCLTFGIQRLKNRYNNHGNIETAAAAAQFTCSLYYCDYTRAHRQRDMVETYPNGYSYVLAHRREYRPSLVRSEWRVAIHRAPDRVLRLRAPTDTWPDVLRRQRKMSPIPDFILRQSGGDHKNHNQKMSSSPMSNQEEDTDHSLLFDIRTVAEHGTLLQPVHGMARIRVRCYGDIVDPSTPEAAAAVAITTASSVVLPADPQSAATTSHRRRRHVTLDIMSPELTLFNGRAASTGSWLEIPSLWEQCIGRWMPMDVRAVISRIVPDEVLKTPFPGGEDEARLETTLMTMVHRDADTPTATTNSIAPHDEAVAAAPVVHVVLAQEQHKQSSSAADVLFSTSLVDCAPLMRREDECCLRGVMAFVAAGATGDDNAADIRSQAGHASSAQLEHAYVVLNVSMYDMSNGTQSRNVLSCVELVDGYTSHIDEDGVARFPNLVVRTRRHDPQMPAGYEHCVVAENNNTQVVRLSLYKRSRFLTEEQQRAPEGVKQESLLTDGSFISATDIVIPYHLFHESCGEGGKGVGGSTHSRPQPLRTVETKRENHNLTSSIAHSITTARAQQPSHDNAPILVSVPAHECLPCLESFLANIRAFVWPSIVVVHFPSRGVTIPSAAELARLNLTHPYTYINTAHIDSVVGVRLLHIHAVNIEFALTDLTHLPETMGIPRWSHALLLASNEMFVKHGVVEYMQRFDAVWMTNPTPNTGALFEHHGDGAFHWTRQEFHTQEEMLRYPPIQWGFVWPDAIVADHWLAGSMRRRNLTKYPMHTVLLEGTFFRYPIAVEFTKEMLAMFDPFDFCEEPMLYPHCEIYAPTFLQDICDRPGVRCGHRVTTMMWLYPDWTARVDDVRRVRCSPFEVPFGFKRIPRSMKDPVRVAVMELTAAAAAAQSQQLDNKSSDSTPGVVVEERHRQTRTYDDAYCNPPRRIHG